MSNATVQANCPGCRAVLHIPLAWATQAVKCQACGTMVKAAPSAPAPVTFVQPLPGEAYIPPAVSRIEDEFAALDEPRPTATKRTYNKPGNGLLYGVIGAGVLMLSAAAVLAFLNRDKLASALHPKPTDTAMALEPQGIQPRTSAMTGAAPRRMLALSVTKYLYCNPLLGGVNRNGVSEFSEAIRNMAFRWDIPESKENNQLFVLSDAEGKLMSGAAQRPMLKSIVLETLSLFCETSRGQDRIVIYFGGHATVIGDAAYLVTMEGDLTDADTLIPLADVWKQLSLCPAQQKVVLFDVCRLSTDDNAIRPGSEPMSEPLEKLLHSPPEGVQVLTSCRAGQTAAEFRGAPDPETPQGSAFLGALRAAVRRQKPDAQARMEDYPVHAWLDGVTSRLQTMLGSSRVVTPKLSGTGGGSKPIVPEEAFAVRFPIPAAPQGADIKEVQAVFDALDTPSLLGTTTQREKIEQYLTFSPDTMQAYRPDVPPEEIQRDPQKFPSRSATLAAFREMRKEWARIAEPNKESLMRDGLSQAVDDKLKKEVEKEQNPLAKLALRLDNIIENLEECKADAGKEPSKYWQAMYQFALAQAKLRHAFIEEVNVALGKIRLNEIEGAERGVRLVQIPKMKNKKVAAEAKEAQVALERLAKSAKGTPWEVMAKQWRSVSLGLEWRAREANADTTAVDEKK